MPPEEFDSLDAKSLKGLVLSLLAKIDELFEQNKKLLEQNSALLERIAELEGRGGGKPPKNPKNSSLPTSSGQKANVADDSGRMPQRPPWGRARALPKPRRDPRLLCRALRLRWKGIPQGSGARARLRSYRDPSNQALDDTEQLVQG